MPSESATFAVPLSNATLNSVSASIARPQYDRRLIRPRLVHIGVGGFNRSHLAVYLDDLLSCDASQQWGELGIGLLTGDRVINKALASQDFLYGVLELDRDRESYRIIGSLVGHLYAPESVSAVLQRLSSPECSIISLTVTEGGYFSHDASGRFLADHPDILHDLEHPDTPRTWLGFVAEAALLRMRLGHPPFTVLSCDNVQSNGVIARNSMLAFAGLRSESLRRWIEQNVSFPNSMVDRITPRTTEDHRSHIERRFGVLDRTPVVCESFRQWVLEDQFAAGRPECERVGAQMVTDVAPYERTKMRMLNGGHSAVGYAADLLSYTTIDEAMSDPLLRRLLVAFMAEVRQTLVPLPGIDLDSYSTTIVRRFSNPAIRDQVARICSQGCAKIAEFILPSLLDLVASGMLPQVIPVVLATWLYDMALHDRESPGSIDDSALESLRPFLAAGGSDATRALSAPSLLGERAASLSRVLVTVQMYMDGIRNRGLKPVLSESLGQDHP